jgi:hypothetical protein
LSDLNYELALLQYDCREAAYLNLQIQRTQRAAPLIKSLNARRIFMKREERALQLWSLLVLAAKNRQILTYDIVAKATGMMTLGIGNMLRPIQQYCIENDLPPLTSIIVNGSTGLPGTGFIAAENVPKAQLETFEHDWTEHKVPSPEEFGDAYSRDQKTGKGI